MKMLTRSAIMGDVRRVNEVETAHSFHDMK